MSNDAVLTHTYSRPTVAVIALAATGAWAASVAVGATLTVNPLTHQIALIAHVLSLVGTFGAVLLVDWVGFLWLVGRRRLNETSRLESAAMPLIWGGLGGLLVSGALMNPNITSPITLVKLAAVLILMLNGIFLIPLMRKLHQMPPETRFADIDPGKRFHLVSCMLVSQACWWTTIVVGFINASGG